MATLVFCFLMLLSVVLALLSRRGHARQGVRDFFVASHQFGPFLVFFLSAGEIYSLSTMMGFPGGIYAKGVSYGVWFMGFVLLAYPVGYFLGPKIWEAGKKYDAITLPDLFKGHFESRFAETMAAFTAILFLLPWGQLQFTGLLFALKGMEWGFSSLQLIALAACFAFGYVAIAGVRASAFIAILKDVLMVVAIAAVGLAVLSKVGLQSVFEGAANRAGNSMNSTQLVFSMSTMLFQSLGLYMFPYNVQNLFTAKSANTIRRTQMVMPLYMLMFPFLVLAAHFASGHEMKLASANDAFFATASALLPNWMLGMVAAAAALSGLVVLAGLCLAIGPIFTRNLMPGLSEARQKSGSKAVILVYLGLSMVLAVSSSNLMVTILNTAFNGITQFFPGVLIVSLGMRVKGYAVAVGMLAGQILSVVLYLENVTLSGMNVGLVSLLVNVVIVLLLNAVTGKRTSAMSAQ
ncbi:sodium:solute symporter [Burkholderia sp. WAC0059]|uniref:sodium:solute symporter family protein n=1 Tax=Burkholderia sp. WAC0059 TaxID=2066022 RepID=UPI000C7EC586|nr:sodium:solute symporter [Burkholderia sp. WAC0059]PLZ02143.1 sodium:solute symporter [Burkholderia sp. WAC0059]